MTSLQRSCILAVIALANVGYSQFSWQPISSPKGGVSLAMLVSEANSRVWSGNGFYTSDNGATWVAKPNGLVPGTPQSHFAMAKNDDGYLFTGNFGGGYRSTNGGDDWTPISSITEIVCYGTHGDDVWAGSYQGVIYHSTNKGATWEEMQNDDYFATDVMAIVPFGQTVYAGTYGNGVMKSGDGGQTWTAVNTGLNNAGVESLLATDSSTLNLLAGTNGVIYFTSTGGADWTERINLGKDIFAFAQHPNGTIYAATSGGIYRAVGPLGTWNTANTGLTTLDTRSVVVDKNTGYVYAGTSSDGVFRSTNGGDTWEQVGTPVAVFSLTRSGTQLIAGTNDGAFIRRDADMLWQQTTEINSPNCSALLRDEYQDSRVLAGTRDGVFRTDNAGINWVPANTGLQANGSTPAVRDFCQTSGSDVFAATPSGVFHSTNMGLNWAPSNTGFSDSSVYSLAYDKQYMYAATADGIYRTDNEPGVNWQRLPESTTLGYVARVFVTPAPFRTVLAGTSNSGIYRSTDFGSTWAPTDILTASIGQFLTFNGVIFASTQGEGVYASSDDGRSWKPLTVGMQSLTVYSLALDDFYLLAGTLDGGIYRSSENLRGVEPENADDEVRIYPNPASTNFWIDLPDAATVELYDLTGRKVLATTADESISIASLPNGSYQVRIVSGEKILHKNLLVMH